MTQSKVMFSRKVVFGAACTGMLLFGICLITLGSIASDLREKLQINELSSGTLFSILPLGILSGSLLFGPIVDKYGYRILLVVSSLLMFAGFEGIAFSSSAGILKLFILLIGFGGGAVNGATNALVSDISDKEKGANLSLLGVFYGIGALGMPLVSGFFKGRLGFEPIVAAVGLLTLATGIFFLVISYPLPKQSQGFPLARGFKLVKDKLLIMIAFFLFFQSGFEGIIYNWTTTYLIKQQSVELSSALYALSSFVAGMAAMRLLIGSVLRKVSVRNLLITSFSLILLGLLSLKTGYSYNISFFGLVLLGAGLAGGFPIMLGFVGDQYSEISGTAFSLVFFIALFGNTMINYGMGMVAQYLGVQHLITVAFCGAVIMIILCFLILNKIKTTK